VSSEKEVINSLMSGRGKYKLLEKDNFQAIVLPYKDKAMSMIILLPVDVGGLSDLENQLIPKNCIRCF
jgi:serine protease inhibitor